jgi:hypothetical protein
MNDLLLHTSMAACLVRRRVIARVRALASHKERGSMSNPTEGRHQFEALSGKVIAACIDVQRQRVFTAKRQTINAL